MEENKAVMTISTANENAKLPAMRQMTRKQVRALRAAGHDLVKNGTERDVAAVSELVDWVLENIYPEIGEDVAYSQVFGLALTTYKAIYEATELEIKN